MLRFAVVVRAYRGRDPIAPGDMQMTQRNFVWYELMPPDKAASEVFYAAVVGWNMVDSGMPGGHYTLARVGERPTVGFMAKLEQCDVNAPPGWTVLSATAPRSTTPPAKRQ